MRAGWQQARRNGEDMLRDGHCVWLSTSAGHQAATLGWADIYSTLCQHSDSCWQERWRKCMSSSRNLWRYIFSINKKQHACLTYGGCKFCTLCSSLASDIMFRRDYCVVRFCWRAIDFKCLCTSAAGLTTWQLQKLIGPEAGKVVFTLHCHTEGHILTGGAKSAKR